MANQPQSAALHGGPRPPAWPFGLGFVYLGISPWEGMWKNRHQLMSRFAAELPVLYVEPWQRLRRLRRQPPSVSGLLGELRRPLVAERDGGVRVFRSPAYLPVSGSARGRRATLGLWVRQVRRAATRCGIRRPVLWVSHPEMLDVVGCLDEVLSIYHIVDDYGGYTEVANVERLEEWEGRLLDRVDLSIAVTPELIAAREGRGRSLMLVENAVDYEAFRAAAERRDLPRAIASIPAPRYGYSGLIGARLDLDLLLQLAHTRADCSLVLVGKVDPLGCEERLAALRALPNVHFLGELPATEVPAHVAGFDVGLLPYTINRETRNISPLKLYEYLAAGKPVVATPIPAARRHADMLELADSAQGFSRAAQAVLATDNATLRARRQSFAAGNTWNHRVRQITAALLPLVSGSSEGGAGA